MTKGGDNNNRIEMSNLSIALSDKIVIINTFAFTAIKNSVTLEILPTEGTWPDILDPPMVYTV